MEGTLGLAKALLLALGWEPGLDEHLKEREKKKKSVRLKLTTCKLSARMLCQLS